MVKTWRSLSRLGNAGNSALVLRIVLGTIFIVAGAGKLFQGSQFLPLAGYQFLPQSVAHPLDLILPWAELSLGILLVTGYCYRFIRYTSLLFITAFIGANCYSLATGNSAPCNCFGGILPLTHWRSLIIDFAMLLISVVLLASSPKPLPAKLRRHCFVYARAFLFCLLMIAVSFPSITYAAAPNSGTSDSGSVTYSTMKLSPAQLAQREAAFDAAPAIASSPGLTANSVTAALPASFSLLPYLQYTPAQRNQGSVGNCWVWAGTGLMEIALNVNNSIKDRLSIQYFDSNYTGGWAGCGGWLGQLADFYNSPATDMAIPWSNQNANYQDSSRGGCPNTSSVSAGSIVTTPNYPTASHLQVMTVSTTGVGQQAAIANIQSTLLQNKAVEFDFELPTTADWNNFFSFWSNQPENYVWAFNSSYGNADSGNAGHGVLCVGYDTTDPNNPYWIMLNSWGTASQRPNGLFRVSMNMNYDATFRLSNRAYQSFIWSTLNNVFAPALTPGPAAQLSFTTQPSVSNTTGIAFSTQPVVKVQDASGNTVTTSNAAVTVAITGGTGTSGAALSGTGTANAVNGIATFSGLSINLAGAAYTLTATSPGLSSAVSTTFNVISGTAVASISAPPLPVSPGAQFTVSLNVQPNNSIAGVQFSLSFDPSLVSVNSVNEGNLLKQNGAITFFNGGQIDNNAGTITAMYGAILSAGQSVSTSGTFAVITFTAGANGGTSPLILSNVIIGDVNGESLPVTMVDGQVSIASAAVKLGFTTQPSLSNTAGIAFSTQPVVKVQDAGGNTVTASNAAVTLAITGGTGTGGAVLAGTTTVNAVNGVASFSGLSINLAGTGYTLTASSAGLTSATSTSFSVSSAGSGSFLSGWSYRKQMKVAGTTAGIQTNYQLQLKVYKGTGTDSGASVYLNNHSRDDFADIRFTKSDGTTLLNYWIESYVSGTSAVVWVKFDSIPASPGTATFYIYYGNTGASSASSGGNTFIFFDDFPGSSVDLTKWNVGGSPSVTGGLLTEKVGDSVGGKTNYGFGYALRAKAKSPVHGASWGTLWGWYDAGGYNLWQAAGSSVFQWWTNSSGGFHSGNDGSIDTNFHLWDVERISSSKTAFVVDGTTYNATLNLSTAPEFVVSNPGDGSAQVVTDWILIRNYVYPEPTWSVWGSETSSTSAGFLSGWSYRKQMKVAGSTAGIQTNYQLQLKVYKGTGTDSGASVYLNNHSRDDFADIRFTKSDGTTLLNYWIESYVSGTSAVVWVKFDSIPASPGTATFYIYYGNTGASSASSGGNTFIFFDDFPGSSVDLTKWNVGGSPSVSGGLLTEKVGDSVGGKTNYGFGYALRAKAKSPVHGTTWGTLWGWYDAGGYNLWQAVGSSVFQWWTNSSGGFHNGNDGSTDTNFHLWDVERISSSKTSFIVDGTTYNATLNLSTAPEFVVSNPGDGSAQVVTDWILIRNYVYPEPTWGVWGSETTP